MPIRIPSVRERGLDTTVAPPELSGTLGGLARGASALGDVFTNAQLASNKKHNDATVRAADADFQERLRQIDNDYSTLNGRDAHEGFEPYRARVQAARDEIFGTLANDDQRAAWEPIAERRRQTHISAANKRAVQGLADWEVSSSTARMETAQQMFVSNTDPDVRQTALDTMTSSLKELQLSNGWSDEETANRLRDLKDVAHRQVINNMTADGELDSAIAAKAYLDEHGGEILPENQAQITKALQVIQDHNDDRFVSNMELAIAQGNGSAAMVDRLFESGKISGSKRTQMMKGILAANKVEQAKNDVRTSVTIGQPMDYKDPVSKKAVDAYYREQVELDPSVQVTKAVSIAANTGIFPESAASMLRAYGRAGNPQQIQTAVQMVDALQNVAPFALDDMSKKDLTFLQTASELIRGGTDPEEAISLLRAQMKKADGEQDVLKARYKLDLDDDGTENGQFVRDEFASFFAIDPDRVPAELEAAFELQTQTEFNRLGKLDEAREQAMRNVKRFYRNTGINGSREVMAVPPEVDTGLSTEELRTDLGKFASGLGVDTLDDVTVISDAITKAMPRGTRSYAIVKKNAFGLNDNVYNPDGTPARWTPSVQEIRESQHAEAVRKAKAERTLDTTFSPQANPRPGVGGF